MLFTDGTILSIQELREHDNFVLDVASTESIDLSSKLAVAQREIGYEIQSFLTTRRASAELSNVVVNQQMRDLLATHVLSIVYRDAYNLHLNDRYLGRWKEFTRASERGLMRLYQNGIGITTVAVAQAAKPTVTVSPDGGLASGMYAIHTAWQHISGTIGERSPAMIVDCSGGSIGVDPGRAPINAVGWHVFAAELDSPASRQNHSILAPETVWTQSAALRQDLAGPEVSGADYYVRSAGLLSRG
ncbi:MAG TPA: hypothetical protein VEX68_23115 [Bryobacteraceae bacterium]|nr:hypothetical protein [Bryobacteraceae bacterium]